VILKAADPKKSKFTIAVIADDKTTEKTNRLINEPIQIIPAKGVLYELVVNTVGKDIITGYLSVPKFPPTRASN
jgi:hypothetical protein